MRPQHWEKNLAELVRRTAIDLPADVEKALRRLQAREKKSEGSGDRVERFLETAAGSREKGTPLCDHSGLLQFYFRVPVGFDTNMLASRARSAVSRATRQGFLCSDTVDALSGAPYKTNVAPASPVFHFRQGARKTIEVCLVMHDAGCENVSRQYSLPFKELGADRNLEGAVRCVLDAVARARIAASDTFSLGVCIGGNRESGHAHAKEQFLRRFPERSPVRALSRLENRLLKEVGNLRRGDKSIAALAVKVGTLSRLEHSYFVTVSFMPWACRRRGVLLGPEGGVRRWLY